MEVVDVKNINEIKETVKENFPFAEKSYPLRNDINEVMSELIERIDSSVGGVLALKDGDKVLGALSYFFEEKENYCQTTFIFTVDENKICSSDEVIEKLFAALKNRFPGYEIYIGVDENFKSVISYMEKRDASLIASSFDFRLKKDSYKTVSGFGEYNARKVLKKDFNEYLKFHEKYFDEEDMYWDSRKVSHSFDRFNFYVVEKNNAENCGVLFITKPGKKGLCEVFGIMCDNAESGCALLYKAVTDCIANEAAQIMILIDEDDESYINIVEKCGFTNTGHYMCFII